MSRRTQKKRPQKAEPPRARGGRLRRAAAILLAVALIGGAVGGALLFHNLWSGGGAAPKTAVIVDQLSLTQPNPDFAAKATETLEQAGYTVDYFSGEQVTVDFYRKLPTHDYDLLILRVHSGIAEEVDPKTGEKTKMEYVSLFTGEPYDETKYRDERYPEVQADRVGKATYYEGASPLFGIGPDFIRYSMRGRFDKTLIILMGCDGLRSTRTAEGFLEKGASAFVSWSRPVSAAHTDTATERLLEKLLVDGLGVGDAVRQTAAEVGPDPDYGAELRVLPESP
jgi:hypothetical protein